MPENGPNHAWAHDIVIDTSGGGQSLKCLSVVDEFTGKCPAIDAAGSIRSARARWFRQISHTAVATGRSNGADGIRNEFGYCRRPSICREKDPVLKRLELRLSRRWWLAAAPNYPAEPRGHDATVWHFNTSSPGGNVDPIRWRHCSMSSQAKPFSIDFRLFHS